MVSACPALTPGILLFVLAGCYRQDEVDFGGSETSNVATSDGSETGSENPRQPCERYIDCVAAVAPGAVAGAVEGYGPNGTCWTPDTEAICVQACIDARVELAEQFPDEPTCTQCQADADCSFDASTPFCDRVQGRCVESLPVPLCSLEGLKASAPNPIVSGDGPEQIPTVIGEILVNNCGCHYADDLDRTVGDYPSSGRLRIATWADWHGDLSDGLTVLDAAASYLDPPNPVFGMPPPSSCTPKDSPETEPMDPEDRAALLAWVRADAPDGASWPPP